MNRKIGVILSYVLMIFEVLSTLLLTPFILRTIGQAEYGVYKLSAAIVAYLLLLDLGIGNAVTKYVAQYRATGETEQSRKFLGVVTIYYGIIAFITLLIGVVLVIIFPNAFAKGLTGAEILLGQKLLSITILNAAVTLGTAAYANIIIAYEKFAVAKGWAILQIIIKILLTFIALKMGMGTIGIVLINFLLTLLCRGFFVLYVLFGLRLKPKLTGIQWSFIKKIIGYSSLILLQMLATQINAFLGQVLLGALVPAGAVLIGVYGIGTQLVQYFQSIGSSVTGVLMPGVVQMVERGANSEQLCYEMIRIGRIIFMVLICIFGCFLLYGKQFIALWVGEGNIEAYAVSALLMLAYTFILTESIGEQILWARNQHKESAFFKLAIVVLNILLTIVLIKWRPLLGATIGTFISLFLGDIVVMNIIFKKKINISLKEYYKGLFRGILPSFGIMLSTGYLFSLLCLSGWLGFFMNISIMLFIYAVSMCLFGFSKYEKALFKGIIGKIFKRSTSK